MFSIIVDMLKIYDFGYREVLLRVDAKQGAPKDGNSSFECFQVTRSLSLTSTVIVK